MYGQKYNFIKDFDPEANSSCGAQRRRPAVYQVKDDMRDDDQDNTLIVLMCILATYSVLVTIYLLFKGNSDFNKLH